MDVREKLVELQLKADIEDETSENTTQHREYIADLMIAHGVTVQEWISVNSPPKERGEYLCYFKYEPEGPDVICQNVYYGSGFWMSEPDRVTHWQYLPKPPKGE